MQSGFHFVGVIVAFETTEWSPGKFNNHLVMDNPYTDRYGQTSSNYVRISINAQDVQRIRQLADDNKGQQARVSINPNLKSGTSQSGKPYAFNDYYMPKGFDVELLNAPKLAKVS